MSEQGRRNQKTQTLSIHASLHNPVLHRSETFLVFFQRNVERRCRALYDCEADNDDELTFEEGDVIIILNEETEDENWMEGHLLNDSNKRGLFPVSFVHMLSD